MNQLEKFREIKAFLFEIDGVLTGLDLLVNEQGEVLRSVNSRDLIALQKAVAAGFPVGIMNDTPLDGIRKVLEGIGIRHFFFDPSKKLADFQLFLQDLEIDADALLYMGSDLAGLPIMRKIGLPTCARDAVPEVIASSLYISALGSGDGCIRDVVEKVLRLHKKWHPVEDHQ